MLELAVMIEGQDGLNWPRWQAIARATEDGGFAALYRSDHFVAHRGPRKDALELWASQTWLASHTRRIEFGPLVSPVSFRDAVMLTRQALTLDSLSGGRFVFGVGVGWMEREHAMFGYELGDKRTRMARLAEALEVITRLAKGDEPAKFDGSFYRLSDAWLLPRSPRPGGPRLLVGGSGPRRTLPLTARYADVWNCGSRSPDAFQEASRRLDELLPAEGRAPADLRRTLMQQVICYRDEADLGRRLRLEADKAPGQSPAELLAAVRTRSPSVIAGRPEQVVEQILAYGAAGVEEIMIQRFDLDDIEGLQLIAEEVGPHVARAAGG